MSLISVQYFDNGKVRKDFLGFVNCHEVNFKNFETEPILSGKIIASTALAVLEMYGLEQKFCVGISTDGCRVIADEKADAVLKLQKSLINATSYPCHEIYALFGR
jgi:hypothetical protein